LESLIGALHHAQRGPFIEQQLGEQHFGIARPPGSFLARRFGAGATGNLTSIDYSNTSALRGEELQLQRLQRHAQHTATATTTRGIQAPASPDAQLDSDVRQHSKLEFRNPFQPRRQPDDRTGRDPAATIATTRSVTASARSTAASCTAPDPERKQLEWTLGWGKAISKEPDFRRISNAAISTAGIPTAFAASSHQRGPSTPAVPSATW
jgi:hypothetical protein